MKKISFLFFFLPLFAFSQTTLVKWFRTDLSPTVTEQHITSAPVSGVANHDYGIENAFYSTNNNFSNATAPDPARYIQFKISADNGYRIQLSGFAFSARKQGGDEIQKFQIKFSKNSSFSTSQTLMGETVTNASYISYAPNFPANTFVESGESMYVRIYVYNTNNNLHVRHDQTGSIAPALSGNVTLTNPVKPIANDDKTGTQKNSAVIIDVLGNDDYRFSGVLTAINTLNPTHGTVNVNGFNSITYTPDPNYLGYDHFYYTITNSVGISNTAKVEIQVIEGVEKVLVRWNKTDKTAKNYTANVAGGDLKVTGENIEINDNEVLSAGGKAFMLSNLPNPQQFDGRLDPSKYLSLSVSPQNADSFAYLKSLKLAYRGRGSGNLTIKWSKSADFSEKVYTVADDIPYSENWMVKDFNLLSGVYLFPGEVIYFRIYTYNTYNTFLIDFIPNGESGPAISGITTIYSPEPCTTTVSWDGARWSGTPNINTKAILNAGYSTAANGSFEACNLTVSNGKLTINPTYSVKVLNEINVNSAASVEIQSDANLVQVNDDAALNSGVVSAFREIKIGKARNQYNYLGSPVVFSEGQSFKTIYAGTSSVLAYKESTNLFSNFAGVAPAGKGLALKEPKLAVVGVEITSVTAKFIGTPQNGKITYPLDNSNTGTNTAFGYNLVANPYPSNIDIAALYQLNKGTQQGPNISATFYFWDNGVNSDVAQTQQGSSYSGQSYAVFNALAGKNGTGTSAAGYLNNNIIGKKTPTNIVSVGQGFIVRALTNNYALKFSNGIRTGAEPETKFFGKSGGAQEEENRYWLKMISPENLTSSAAVIYFEEGNNSFGEEDAESKGASDEIFTTVGDKKLSIEGKSPFAVSDRVFLGAQHFVAGIYTLAIEKKEGIFAAGQNIYLKDKQTGIITNISEGNYTFTTIAGEQTNRFEIIYQPEIVLATDSTLKESLLVYKVGTDFIVKYAGDKIVDLQLFEAGGRLILQKSGAQKEWRFPSQDLTEGMYIVKATLKSGEVFTRKIRK